MIKLGKFEIGKYAKLVISYFSEACSTERWTETAFTRNPENIIRKRKQDNIVKVRYDGKQIYPRKLNK